MILETDRMILRPWKETDAESLYRYAKDDRVGPIAGWPPHTSVENSLEVIKTVLSEPDTYAVCLKGDNEAIGSVGLMVGRQSNIDLPDTEGEIGYWIGVPFWGQGLRPEAVREIIRYAFKEKQLDTLWCGYFEGNDRSRRVSEKCGFIYHHTNKDIRWKLMDDIRTEHITRLSKEEWKNSFEIRGLSEDEKPSALDLAWRVFSEYGSPDYAPEGTEEFRKCLHDEAYLHGLRYYGAFDGRKLIGETAIRTDKKHICFFFVDGRYHRLGIGTRMFDRLLRDYPNDPITLNSSPYALSFYKAIGFVPTGEEQTVNGIRFTQMVFEQGRKGFCRNE